LDGRTKWIDDYWFVVTFVKKVVLVQLVLPFDEIFLFRPELLAFLIYFSLSVDHIDSFLNALQFSGIIRNCQLFTKSVRQLFDSQFHQLLDGRTKWIDDYWFVVTFVKKVVLVHWKYRY
jgi:hypothetical protein